MTWVIAGTTLASLAMGAGKYAADSSKAGRQRKLAAETQRYSPWTGLEAKAPDEPSLAGTELQFGSMGAQMGMGIHNMGVQQGMQEKMGGLLDSEIARNNALASSMGGGSITPSIMSSGGAAPGGGGGLPAWFGMGYEDPINLRSVKF